MHVITGTERGLVVQDVTSGGVGRWAPPPHVPDRCYYCPTNAAAVDYTERGGWRFGRCVKCAEEGSDDTTL